MECSTTWPDALGGACELNGSQDAGSAIGILANAVDEQAAVGGHRRDVFSQLLAAAGQLELGVIVVALIEDAITNSALEILNARSPPQLLDQATRALG